MSEFKLEENEPIESQLNELIRVQNELLQATSDKKEAQLLSARLSEEAIKKHEEAIETAKKADSSSREVMKYLLRLIDLVETLVNRTETIDELNKRFDFIIIILQTLVQVMATMTNNKEQVDRLQKHLFELTRMSRVTGEQVNVGEKTTGEQNKY